MDIFDYDNVLLLPRKCRVESRAECDTSVEFGGRRFKLPAVPANMKTVLDERIAAWLAANGYFYVMHRFDLDNVAFARQMREAGGDVIGIDWRIHLDEAWALVGHDRAVQGNLDPLVLFAPLHEIERRVEDILRRAGNRPGHIFNLGHGILPTTPVDHVAATIDMIHKLSQR